MIIVATNFITVLCKYTMTHGSTDYYMITEDINDGIRNDIPMSYMLYFCKRYTRSCTLCFFSNPYIFSSCRDYCNIHSIDPRLSPVHIHLIEQRSWEYDSWDTYNISISCAGGDYISYLCTPTSAFTVNNTTLQGTVFCNCKQFIADLVLEMICLNFVQFLKLKHNIVGDHCRQLYCIQVEHMQFLSDSCLRQILYKRAVKVLLCTLHGHIILSICPICRPHVYNNHYSQELACL